MATAVLLSGGVDSSVALLRLVHGGVRDVTAFYLKIWLEDELAFLGRCPWEDDLRHARSVCEALGVRLEVVPLQREYRDRVVASALQELRSGHTPSPDVTCNRDIKFGAFLDRVGPSFEVVATGHHARVDRDGSRVRLLRGTDRRKDQTYFLCRLDQAQLRRCRFPVGDLPKREVRRIARDHDLSTADRPDSQGICFLGRVPYPDFVEAHLGQRRGAIREAGSGRRLGGHPGHWFFTIGQRRGLGLAGGPWFVVAKEVDANTVWVVHASRLSEHARREFAMPCPHWIAGPPGRDRLEVRVRHGEATAWCTVHDVSKGGVRVVLDTADPGIAPGQVAALYDGEECLGGGVIS